jgi:hypothetical protein
MLNAQPKRKVGIVALLLAARLLVEVGKQRRLISRPVRRINGNQCVMDRRVGRLELVDDIEEIADSLVLSPSSPQRVGHQLAPSP